MTGYGIGHFLTGPVGNNRFDYDRRSNPSLYIPALIEGDMSDVEESNTVAIECDVGHMIATGYGLKHFIFLRNTRVPTWICDNHNHAYAFWHMAHKQGYINAGLPVVHIDQHTDLAVPARFRDPDEDIYTYTNSVLTIADFIIPAMREGLIAETHIITDESRESARCFVWHDEQLVRQQRVLPDKDFILDIDLDYFSQGFDEAETFATVRYWLAKADIITIATSPLFIEQEDALRILGLIGQYL